MHLFSKGMLAAGALVLLGSACQSPAPTPTAVATPPPTIAAPVATAPLPGGGGVPSVPSPSIPPSPTATLIPQAALAVGEARRAALTQANAAFARGDVKAAADLYDRFVLLAATGESAAGSTTLNQFALFRSLIAHAGSANEAAARKSKDELEVREPTGPFTQLAAQFWEQYSMTADARPACVAVSREIGPRINAQLAMVQSVDSSVTLANLCSLPARS